MGRLGLLRRMCSIGRKPCSGLESDVELIRGERRRRETRREKSARATRPPGVTRARLESFDRAITLEPGDYPDRRDALIREFRGYLGILKVRGRRPPPAARGRARRRHAATGRAAAHRAGRGRA